MRIQRLPEIKGRLLELMERIEKLQAGLTKLNQARAQETNHAATRPTDLPHGANPDLTLLIGTERILTRSAREAPTDPETISFVTTVPAINSHEENLEPKRG
jgi:hypothetical protein